MKVFRTMGMSLLAATLAAAAFANEAADDGLAPRIAAPAPTSASAEAPAPANAETRAQTARPYTGVMEEVIVTAPRPKELVVATQTREERAPAASL